MLSLLTIFVAVTVVLAQNANPISVPTLGQIVTAGSAFVIKWTPDNVSTVTLTLRKGQASNLLNVSVIASDIPNLGQFNWLIPSSTPSGTDYSISIAEGPSQANPNFSPFFGITGGSSTNTTAFTNSSSPRTTMTSNSSVPTSLTTQSGSASTTAGGSVQSTTTTKGQATTTPKSDSTTLGSSLVLAIVGIIAMV